MKFARRGTWLLIFTIVGIIFGVRTTTASSAFGFFRSEDDDSGAKKEEASSQEVSTSRRLWSLVASSSDRILVENRTITSSSGGHLPVQVNLQTRLQKLEHHFNTLNILSEDCRQRLLCNLAENPKKFSPLSDAFLDETSYTGDEKVLASALLSTNEGAQLLTYIEAAQKGSSRKGCEIWTYRCPVQTTQMIDFKALQVWKELYKFLTVKFLATPGKGKF